MSSLAFSNSTLLDPATHFANRDATDNRFHSPPIAGLFDRRRRKNLLYRVHHSNSSVSSLIKSGSSGNDLDQTGLAYLPLNNLPKTPTNYCPTSSDIFKNESSEITRDLVYCTNTYEADKRNPVRMTGFEVAPKALIGSVKKQLFRKKAFKDDVVEVSYLKDKNGQIRDEYGFKVCKGHPAQRCDGKRMLSYETAEMVLSNHALRKRQTFEWELFLRDINFDFSSMHPSVYQLWRLKHERCERLTQDYLKHLPKDHPVVKDMCDNTALQNHNRLELRGLGRGALRSFSALPLNLNQKTYQAETAFFDEYTNRSIPSIDEAELGFSRVTSLLSSRTRDQHNFSSLIRRYGIPPTYRREVWIHCCGAQQKQRMAAPKDQYEEVVKRSMDQKNYPCEMAGDIERDLHRTFPTNFYFESVEGIARMRRVLLAYSLRNERVGYCQSMNFVVAILLLHMDEESAFWCLAAVVEDLLPGRYSESMVGMVVDTSVFKKLVRRRLPRIHAHMEALRFPLECVSYRWFFCLFVNALPLETTLCVWDCFLHEGYKALFKTGIAVFIILQDEILAAKSAQEIRDCLGCCTSPEYRKYFNPRSFLKVAFSASLGRFMTSSLISELRLKCLQSVVRSSNWKVTDVGAGNYRKDNANNPKSSSYVRRNVDSDIAFANCSKSGSFSSENSSCEPEILTSDKIESETDTQYNDEHIPSAFGSTCNDSVSYLYPDDFERDLFYVFAKFGANVSTDLTTEISTFDSPMRLENPCTSTILIAADTVPQSLAPMLTVSLSVESKSNKGDVNN